MRVVTVRFATASEHALLEALQWRASLNNANDRNALLNHPDAIEIPLQQILDNSIFVAENKGRIEGFAIVLLRDDGDFELDGLFVEPDCWRQGIGRTLVDHCAEVAGNRGANCLHVVGNPHAQSFYTACRFQTIGTKATRFGMGILMRRLLG